MSERCTFGLALVASGAPTASLIHILNDPRASSYHGHEETPLVWVLSDMRVAGQVETCETGAALSTTSLRSSLG